MLFEIFALFGAMGIVLLLFTVIILLGDRPVKAFITAMTLMYLLITVYIYLLNMILKRKEKKHTTQ
jgi:membrane protein DedA with SNARE-associated domain